MSWLSVQLKNKWTALENRKVKVTRVLTNHLVAVLLGMMAVMAVRAETIEVVTEEYPPFNYSEGSEIKGLSTEVVRAVLREAKLEGKITVVPWARALSYSQENSNVLIYTIGRNAKRESLYKWIGPIAQNSSVLFALSKRTDIKINSLEDAKQYSIATVNEDVREQYLVQKGFVKGKGIDSSNKYEQGFQKLNAGRVDLWSINELVGYWIANEEKMPKTALRKVFQLSEVSGDYYMAFSQKTSDELVSRLRAALDKVKQSGEYERIQKKYMN